MAKLGTSLSLQIPANAKIGEEVSVNEAPELGVSQRADPEGTGDVADMGNGRASSQSSGWRWRNAPQARDDPSDTVAGSHDDRTVATGSHIAAGPRIIAGVSAQASSDLHRVGIKVIEGGHGSAIQSL
jgi:hypothetical protein